MNCALTQRGPTREIAVLGCGLVLLLFVITGCGSQEFPQSTSNATPMEQVTIEGVTMRYVDKGKGDPLVLVHGLPTSSFLWRHMIEELSAHGRVIAPDLPGYGFSDPPRDGDYTIAATAHLLEAFLDALSIEGGTLVCHDMGGPITVTYALQHPEKYDKLIILDTFLHTDLPPWPLSTKLAKIWPLGEVFMWLGGESIARAGLEEGVVDKAVITDEVVRRYYLPDGKPDKLNATYLGTLRVDYLKDLEFIEQNLGTIEKPTLILWADSDAFLPLELGNRIHEDIQGSRMEVISNCGHFIPEERPERATERIVMFLSG